MVTVRKLRKSDDLGDMVGLSREFFDEYAAHHREFFQIDVFQDSDAIGYFSRLLDMDRAAAFIAIDDDRIIGYITVHVREQPPYWRIKSVGEISGLMVEREYRHRGIAGRLLAEAKAFFRERGVEDFTVYTAVANEPAIRFYQRHGMTPLYTTMLGKAAETAAV
jgi:ribosomal protein S18 acetylase RimI-like enzyme